MKIYFYLFLFHRLFPLEYIFTYAVGNQISDRKYLLELIKRRPKVHKKDVPWERGLNFDQYKTISKNMR